MPITHNNIAKTYSKLNFPKALEWYKKALVIREKMLGKEHPMVMELYDDIAQFEKKD